MSNINLFLKELKDLLIKHRVDVNVSNDHEDSNDLFIFICDHEGRAKEINEVCLNRYNIDEYINE